jgi:hypothetical protein
VAEALQSSAVEVVALPTDWAVGDRFRLHLLEEQEDYRGRGQVAGGGIRIAVDVEVLQKTADGYIFRWTWGKANVLAGSSDRMRLMGRVMDANAGLKVDIRTDQYGTPVAVENLPEIIAFNERGAEIVLEAFREEGLPEPALAQIRKMLGSFLNESTISGSAMKDPQLLHYASGGVYELGVEQQYEDLVPNLLGGEPIPSRASFRLTAVDHEAGKATIEWRQTLDEARARDSLTATLNDLATGMGAPLPQGAGLPNVTIEDTGKFVMDLATGWPVSVHHERVTVIGDMRRVDRSVFNTVPAPV